MVVNQPLIRLAISCEYFLRGVPLDLHDDNISEIQR